jgi:hypothetical protein
VAIVAARRSQLEISLWKTGKGRKEEKELTRKKEKEHTRKKREVSEQPSSTAEIR